MEVLNLRGLLAGGSTVYSRWAVCVEDPQISAFVCLLGRPNSPERTVEGLCPETTFQLQALREHSRERAMGLYLSTSSLCFQSSHQSSSCPSSSNLQTPPLIQSLYCGERGSSLTLLRAGAAGGGGRSGSLTAF